MPPVKAVKTGKLSEKLVRERVKPLFYTRMRLGEFDPPGMNPYLQYNMSLVQSEAHRQLAVKAAMQTFVLLKNENRLLPIRKHFNKIAVSLNTLEYTFKLNKKILTNTCNVVDI